MLSVIFSSFLLSSLTLESTSITKPSAILSMYVCSKCCGTHYTTWKVKRHKFIDVKATHSPAIIVEFYNLPPVSQPYSQHLYGKCTTLCWNSLAAVNPSCSGYFMTRWGCQGNKVPSSFVAKPMLPVWISWCGLSKMNKVINCSRACAEHVQSSEFGILVVLLLITYLLSILRSWEFVHQTVREAAVENF